MSAGAPAPTPLRPGRPWTIVERNLMIYRHTWLVMLAEIFEPMLYLLAFGVGIGQLVGDVPGLRDASITYPQFVAPALLATAAMNGAMNETTFNMYGKLTIDKTYESILTTPCRYAPSPSARCGGRSCVAPSSPPRPGRGERPRPGPYPMALLVIPSALLIGFTFASIGLLVVTLLRSWQDFPAHQLVMLPMFLFATTFFRWTCTRAPSRCSWRLSRSTTASSSSGPPSSAQAAAISSSP